jgi:hypothetical protein
VITIDITFIILSSQLGKHLNNYEKYYEIYCVLLIAFDLCCLLMSEFYFILLLFFFLFLILDLYGPLYYTPTCKYIFWLYLLQLHE